MGSENLFRLPLAPLPYHADIIEYLKRREADLWIWFSADRQRDQNSEAVRLSLLKSTYRIEREGNPGLYEAADHVMAALRLDDGPQAAASGAGTSLRLTIYQSQSPAGLNVSLAYVPGEAHIVLTGPVCSTLNPAELRCVLSHELSHFALLDRWRDYRVAFQLLAAMANDNAATPVHLATARLFDLYGEVYCDRGSLLATRDLAATVSALVKIATGTTEVSGESYLRQTDEIFAKGHPRSEGVTHPETFIRAKALSLWASDESLAAEKIRPVIEGPPALSELDLLGQQAVASATRRLIDRILRPAWMRTDPTLAHARLFFDGFEPGGEPDPAGPPLAGELTGGDEKLRDYYCYVLLDFAAADRDLEDAPLAAGLLLADEVGLGDRFRELAIKELNLRKKQMEALEADAPSIVARAAEAEE